MFIKSLTAAAIALTAVAASAMAQSASTTGSGSIIVIGRFAGLHGRGAVPVASTTATGAYTGTFTVSAAYN